MRLHSTNNYKNYVILIYQKDGYYKSIIADSTGNQEMLIALYTTSYEALSYAKKRIDTK